MLSFDDVWQLSKALIVSQEFKCSSDMLTIASMLSGAFVAAM
jgi:HrpA-like RNA helicase